jgi:hypothetical protein
MYGQQGHRISEDTGLPIKFEQYLQLLDWTGRQLRKDKQGAIPAEAGRYPDSAADRAVSVAGRGDLFIPVR